MKRRNKIDKELINNSTETLIIPKDTSPKIPQRSKLNFDLNIYKRPDLTQKQLQFLELAADKNTINSITSCG
jgi:hypothetical protein